MRTPLAIFAYNRPEHLQRLLQSLSRNPCLKDCLPVLFCDGPKEESQRPAVQATRQVARDWIQEHGGQMVERAENLGLAHSIVDSVKALCEQHGRTIVLEDDLVLRPDFLRFCLEGLHRYRDTEAVKQISGYAYPIKAPTQGAGYFLPLTSGWGWATWHRAWKDFSWNPWGAGDCLKDPEARHRFDVEGAYPYSQMLADRLEGRNQSWGVLWQWVVHRDNGLVLFPRDTLVWNKGYDGTGTHAGNLVEYDSDSQTHLLSALPETLSFPDVVQRNDLAFHRVAQCLRHRVGKPAPFSKKLMNHLQRILR